jgi:hypothetical protein
MKEYEKRLAAKNEKVKTAGESQTADMNEVSSSAMDQGDESSVNSDSVPVSATTIIVYFMLRKFKYQR